MKTPFCNAVFLLNHQMSVNKFSGRPNVTCSFFILRGGTFIANLRSIRVPKLKCLLCQQCLRAAKMPLLQRKMASNSINVIMKSPCMYEKAKSTFWLPPKNSRLPAFFLASSCGKWCHHLSLGCGYLTTTLQ